MNKIIISSVNALDDGSIMLLNIDIEGKENKEKRKLALFTNDYLELGLRKGSELSEEQFDALEEKTKICLAIRKASDLLAYSSPSKKSMVEKLKQRGFEKEVAISAIETLSNNGVINEKNDVERLISQNLKKLYGKKRIISELINKGYDKKDIDEKLKEIDDEIFYTNCATLLQKKIKSVKIKTIDQNTKEKLVAFLQRNGYSFSEIKEAFKTK